MRSRGSSRRCGTRRNRAVERAGGAAGGGRGGRNPGAPRRGGCGARAVSADYLAADAGASEMAAALRRRHAEGATIVPVLVRPCLVDETPLGRLGPLPQNGEPISTWANQDLAWVGVAKAVRDLVADRGAGKTRGLPPPLPRVPFRGARCARRRGGGGACRGDAGACAAPWWTWDREDDALDRCGAARRDRAAVRARRVFARLDGATTGDAVKATVASAAGIPPGPGARGGAAPRGSRRGRRSSCWTTWKHTRADPDGTQAALEVLTEAPDVAVLASVRGTLRPAGAAWKSSSRRSGRRTTWICSASSRRSTRGSAPRWPSWWRRSVGCRAIALLAYAAQGNPLANLRLERRARGPAALDRGGSDKHASWAVCVNLSSRSPRMTAEARRLAAVLAMLPEGAAIEDVPGAPRGAGGGTGGGARARAGGGCVLRERAPAHAPADARARAGCARARAGRP